MKMKKLSAIIFSLTVLVILAGCGYGTGRDSYVVSSRNASSGRNNSGESGYGVNDRQYTEGSRDTGNGDNDSRTGRFLTGFFGSAESGAAVPASAAPSSAAPGSSAPAASAQASSASIAPSSAAPTSVAPAPVGHSSSASGSQNWVTLDAAKNTPGLYLMEDELFLLITQPQNTRELFHSWRNYQVLIMDAETPIIKIPKSGQLVVVGWDSIAARNVVHDGYTIPYRVEFGIELTRDSEICINSDPQYSNYEEWYETVNGEAPYNYASRMLYTAQYWSMMQTVGILTAQKYEEFSFGRFRGTDFVERTVIADQRFFTFEARDGQLIDIEIERTTNGYFKIDFSETPTGYCALQRGSWWVVEFVD